MSILDHKDAAISGINVTVAPRSGKNATYQITEAGFKAEGLKNLPPQAQIIWQVITSACKKGKTDTFTLEEANELCAFLKESNVLKTRQPAKRIFAYYRSVGAKDGGDGFLSRRWLLVK